MSPIEPYPIILLRKEDVLAPEEMGSKSKGWVQVNNDSEPWLFKHPRMSNGQVTGEHWAEKIAAEVAELLQIPHARVDLATLDGSPGSISRRFPELSRPGTELIHGNDILAGTVLGYDRHKQFRQRDHTLDNILTAVSCVMAEDERDAAFRQLAGYVLLDALILNTDRHHENWALIRATHPSGTVTHYVAPTFDHASSLGRNEPPEKLEIWLQEPWRPLWYADRGEGGIYLRAEDDRGANPLKLVEVAARRWPAYFQPWREIWEHVSLHATLAIVDRIPAAVMADVQKRFTKALLQVTFARLNEVLA
jgi:hypothetical protein